MATDRLGRNVDYLRISVTDRCNLRCVYCMPERGVAAKQRHEILAFEEIERFASAAVAEGISKIRLTGGEPLVRKGIVGHVKRLRALTGIEDIALTTNGVLLEHLARPLADAGLLRVNISIDSLDPDVFASVTRGGRLADVLAGLDAALEAGMRPVKVNVVVVRGLDQDLLEFARMTLGQPVHVRFIEYMPIGTPGDGPPPGAGWTRTGHVPTDEILERVAAEGARAGMGTLERVPFAEAPGGWGPARYYRFPRAAGAVGVITPLSHHFCGECNRLRLTADGRLRTCLFSEEETDVRPVLRAGSDGEVRDLIRAALATKPAGHGMRVGTARGMSQIGG